MAANAGILAIPALLDIKAIEGAIVTIGLPARHAQKIGDKKADYVPAQRQSRLAARGYQDFRRRAESQRVQGYKDRPRSNDRRRPWPDRNQNLHLFHDVAWLQQRDWPGLKAVVMVESTRELADKIKRETLFYITSLAWMAHLLGPVVRAHWSIENSLHWVMDMLFLDDECRIRADHAPANCTPLGASPTT
jgi:predicted transposase YbfD/YdcC